MSVIQEEEEEEEEESYDYESISTWSPDNVDSYQVSPFDYDPYSSYDWES
jgi:hypothetical protein